MESSAKRLCIPVMGEREVGDGSLMPLLRLRLERREDDLDLRSEGGGATFGVAWRPNPFWNWELITRRKLDFNVWMCLSLERALSKSGRGETVLDPTDGSVGDEEVDGSIGDEEVAGRAGALDGAFAGAG